MRLKQLQPQEQKAWPQQKKQEGQPVQHTSRLLPQVLSVLPTPNTSLGLLLLYDEVALLLILELLVYKTASAGDLLLLSFVRVCSPKSLVLVKGA